MGNRLNLGCGYDYRKGWINVDWFNKDLFGKTFKTDMNFDLNKFPYPFEDNSIDEISIFYTLEHLDKPIEVIREMFRILKVGGQVEITIPHFSSRMTYADITHYHTFARNSIYSLLLYPMLHGRYEILVNELVISNNKYLQCLSPIINYFWNFYERYLYGYFPVHGCRWVVRKIK